METAARRWWWWYGRHLHIQSSVSGKHCLHLDCTERQASMTLTQSPPLLVRPSVSLEHRTIKCISLIWDVEVETGFRKDAAQQSLIWSSLHLPDMGVFLHVLPLCLTNQILPWSLPANHVPVVKLETALLPAVSCLFRHSCDPPPPDPPPALHQVAGFDPPGSSFLHHYHWALHSIGVFF